MIDINVTFSIILLITKRFHFYVFKILFRSSLDFDGYFIYDFVIQPYKETDNCLNIWIVEAQKARFFLLEITSTINYEAIKRAMGEVFDCYALASPHQL